jgi:ADP-ribosylglycohydrolase
MIGAIAGDIIGSVFEFNPYKGTDFDLFSKRSFFTDDTVLSLAVAEAILTDGNYKSAVLRLGRQHPGAGYGGMFAEWLSADYQMAYYSFGNGSAMRVSPVGFAFNSEKDVLEQSLKSAAFTHNHPEGIKGAQATALTIWLARQNLDKEQIRKEISSRFGYDLQRTVGDIRQKYQFDVTCQGTVPEAIIAFLESEDYEDAIRKTISLGGDADTLGSITGGIAQAFYKEIPQHIVINTRDRLTEDLVDILDRFNLKYGL